jgi:hypothetical protein
VGHGFLLADTAATVFMAGVLWTMQILNYPLLSLVGREQLPAYESAHNRRFGLVVVPGIAVALASTIGLLVKRPRTIPLWMPITVGSLLLVVIASTAALQAPQHARLAGAWSEASHRLLVSSNWIRVVAWSPAAAIALAMCSETFING